MNSLNISKNYLTRAGHLWKKYQAEVLANTGKTENWSKNNLGGESYLNSHENKTFWHRKMLLGPILRSALTLKQSADINLSPPPCAQPHFCWGSTTLAPFSSLCVAISATYNQENKRLVSWRTQGEPTGWAVWSVRRHSASYLWLRRCNYWVHFDTIRQLPPQHWAAT